MQDRPRAAVDAEKIGVRSPSAGSGSARSSASSGCAVLEQLSGERLGSWAPRRSRRAAADHRPPLDLREQGRGDERADLEILLLSVTPIGLTPRSRSQIAARLALEVGSAARSARGRRSAEASARGAPCGRPCRWASAGARSSVVTTDGTMYAGRRAGDELPEHMRPGPAPSRGITYAASSPSRRSRARRLRRRRSQDGASARSRSRRARSGSRGP